MGRGLQVEHDHADDGHRQGADLDRVGRAVTLMDAAFRGSTSTCPSSPADAIDQAVADLAAAVAAIAAG